MAAAGLAPLPVAPLVLVVLPDVVFSLGHLDRLRLPEGECVDRAGGPAPTGGAMAVASALRITRDFNRDSAAEAVPLVCLFILAHEFPFARMQGAMQEAQSGRPDLNRRPFGPKPNALPGCATPRDRASVMAGVGGPRSPSA